MKADIDAKMLPLALTKYIEFFQQKPSSIVILREPIMVIVHSRYYCVSGLVMKSWALADKHHLIICRDIDALFNIGKNNKIMMVATDMYKHNDSANIHIARSNILSIQLLPNKKDMSNTHIQEGNSDEEG